MDIWQFWWKWLCDRFLRLSENGRRWHRVIKRDMRIWVILLCIRCCCCTLHRKVNQVESLVALCTSAHSESTQVTLREYLRPGLQWAASGEWRLTCQSGSFTWMSSRWHCGLTELNIFRTDSFGFSPKVKIVFQFNTSFPCLCHIRSSRQPVVQSHLIHPAYSTVLHPSVDGSFLAPNRALYLIPPEDNHPIQSIPIRPSIYSST